MSGTALHFQCVHGLPVSPPRAGGGAGALVAGARAGAVGAAPAPSAGARPQTGHGRATAPRHRHTARRPRGHPAPTHPRTASPRPAGSCPRDAAGARRWCPCRAGSVRRGVGPPRPGTAGSPRSTVSAVWSAAGGRGCSRQADSTAIEARPAAGAGIGVGSSDRTAVLLDRDGRGSQVADPAGGTARPTADAAARPTRARLRPPNQRPRAEGCACGRVELPGVRPGERSGASRAEGAPDRAGSASSHPHADQPGRPLSPPAPAHGQEPAPAADPTAPPWRASRLEAVDSPQATGRAIPVWRRSRVWRAESARRTVRRVARA